MNYFSLILCCFSYFFGVHSYTNDVIDSCVSNAITSTLNDEDTIAFVYDEFVEVELPKITRNPFLVVRTVGSTHFNVQRIDAYILHLHKREYSTMSFLISNNFWIKRHSLDVVFLIIIEEEYINTVRDFFRTFWYNKIMKVMILTYYVNGTKTYARIHTSNAIDPKNLCGKQCNIINSQDCTNNVSVKFNRSINNLNGCNITFVTRMPKLGYTGYPGTYLLSIVNELRTYLNGNLNTLYEVKDEMLFSQIKKENLIPLETNERKLKHPLDASRAILYHKYLFIVKGGEEVSPVKLLLVTFKPELWIMILIAYIITSLSLWLVTSIIERRFSISKLEKIFLEFISATLWGCFSSIPKRFEIRCIMFCYLIYHIHIVTGFTSNIVSILTTTQYHPGITNVEQLAESELPIFVASICESLVFRHNGEPNGTYEKIKKNVNYLEEEELNDKFGQVWSGEQRGAVMTMKLFVDYYLMHHKRRNINIFNNDIITGGIEVVFDLDQCSFFKETLDNFILRMDELGITQKLQKDMGDKKGMVEISHPIQLNMKHVLCAFVFLLFGLIVATIVFLIEVATNAVINYVYH